MASKVGVYFDASNIMGALVADSLAEATRQKWGDAAPVIKIVPVLADSVAAIAADIGENGLDGVLLCGASPRVDASLYRFEPRDGKPVQVEHVNLREQCALCFPKGDDPELLRLMAIDYINMGMTRLLKTETPDPAIVKGVRRILVIGGGWTGMKAASEAARSGYEVVLVEKTDRLGGAVNNIPVASPLGPIWTDKEPTDLPGRIKALEKTELVTIHKNATVAQLAGEPGQFKATINTADGAREYEIGAVVLAAGWTPLAEKYLAPMGLGTSPKIVTAGQFAKMLIEGKVEATRIAFVLDTTLAEKAFPARPHCASDEVAAAEARG